jgi:hypothetical protein
MVLAKTKKEFIIYYISVCAIVINALLQNYIMDTFYETSIVVLTSYSVLSDDQVVTTQEKLLNVRTV